MFALERKMSQHPYYRVNGNGCKTVRFNHRKLQLLPSAQPKKRVGFTKSESCKSQLLPSAQPPDTTFEELIRLKPTTSTPGFFAFRFTKSRSNLQ